jgi:hypothetical protein
MGDGTKPTTSYKGKLVEFCPVCGTHCAPLETPTAEAPSSFEKCPSCGFDLTLAAPQTPLVPANTPAQVPGFAYLMLLIQCAASLVLGWAFLYLSNPLYLEARQLLSNLAFLSAIVIGAFCLWLRTGRAISWARNTLLALGLVTAPLGVCALAAAIAVAGSRRYCAICLKRIAWSEHYSTCPHCMATFHRYGECREARRKLIIQAWGREPSGDEVGDTCPLCFQSLRLKSAGGRPG